MKENVIENKNHNKSVDIFKVFALLSVLIYHCWVLMGNVPISNANLSRLIALGGEIGVTAFFLLSGYGIFCSLFYSGANDGFIDKKAFYIKRLRRIVPHYYLNIFLVILIGSGGVYLSKGHILDIIAHGFFVHNLVSGYFGEINGVLWTMGVIVQFYLVAIISYKMLLKNSYVFLLSSILFTIILKAVVYRSISAGGMDISNFVAGRQLFTAYDNFAIGMFIAWMYEAKKIYVKNIYGALVTLFSFLLLLIACWSGFRYGIHTDNVSGYTWHTMLALILGLMLYGMCNIHFDVPWWRPLEKVFLWLAKYEYGIYLWHLLIIKNLLNTSPSIIGWIEKGRYISVSVILIILSILAGFVMSVLVDGSTRQYKF